MIIDKQQSAMWFFARISTFSREPPACDLAVFLCYPQIFCKFVTLQLISPLLAPPPELPDVFQIYLQYSQRPETTEDALAPLSTWPSLSCLSLSCKQFSEGGRFGQPSP